LTIYFTTDSLLIGGYQMDELQSLWSILLAELTTKKDPNKVVFIEIDTESVVKNFVLKVSWRPEKHAVVVEVGNGIDENWQAVQLQSKIHANALKLQLKPLLPGAIVMTSYQNSPQSLGDILKQK